MIDRPTREVFWSAIGDLAFADPDLSRGRLSIPKQRDAEVEDLDPAVERQNQIVGADVAMNNPERSAAEIDQLVNGVESTSGVGDTFGGHGRRQRMCELLQEVVERDAGDVLHRDVQIAAILFELVDL